jgi:hypothetical protein
MRASPLLIRLIGIRRLLCGAFVLGFAEIGYALDISLSGDAKLAEEFNSNLWLSPNKALSKPVYGHGFDVDLNLDFSEQKWRSTLTSAFDNRWYNGQDNIDYNNQIFSSKSYYLLNELDRLGLDANYSMASTLTSQFATDVGYAFSRVPFVKRSISPSWQHTISERWLVNLGYTYQDTAYERSGAANNFVDSEAHTGVMGTSYQFNERLKLTSNASYTDYSLIQSSTSLPFAFGGRLVTREVASTIDTLSWLGGFDYSFSETIDVGFSGGVQYNETYRPEVVTDFVSGTSVIPFRKQFAQSAYTLSEIYEAQATKKFENGNLRFSYSSSMSPTLQGILIGYDRYTLAGFYKVSPKITTNMSVSYSSQTGAVQAGVGVNQQTSYNRTYLNFDSSLIWNWAEDWNLIASYRYVTVDYPGQTSSRGTTVDSHSVYMNLQYLFDKFHF